jgi:glutaredoxin
VDYLLFTYPNCQKCEELKVYMAAETLPAQLFKLEDKDGRMKIREFREHIKRNDDGSVKLPTLILRDEGAVAAVLNSRQELEEWLKSRD